MNDGQARSLVGSGGFGQEEWQRKHANSLYAGTPSSCYAARMSFIVSLKKYRPGPGILVTAAFIGPGTVTACTLAGANFGYALLWALVFATFATIILQGMASRVALVTRKGLGEAIMDTLPPGAPRLASAVLLLTALCAGNAAYEGGNIIGAALGISAITGSADAGSWPLGVGLLTIALLAAGKLKLLEKLLIGLVLIMSLSFLAALFVTRPDFGAMFAGFVPTLPDGSILTAMALIGTTVVPYNLFLQAGTTLRYWGRNQVKEAEFESGISIGLGGLVSMAIVATAASAIFGTGQTIENAIDMAAQMKPVYGDFARITLGLGLLGAGLTSAITAPLATGYIVSEIWRSDNRKVRDRRMRWTALVIAVIGTVIASAGYRPVEVIMLAQIANGITLPFVAFFLLWIVNRKDIMQEFQVGRVYLALGWLVALICLGLGIRSLMSAFGLL